MLSLSSRDYAVKAVIIISLFLEFLDQTIITTAIPVIAQDFAISPVDLKFGLSSYYLALVLVIPASGWISDRFGTRRIFLYAMFLFTLGSVLCGLSNSLSSLVAARFVQGAGGALLVPVGRIIILQEVKQAQMITALAWLSLPAVFGPMLGPLVGGTITTYLHWPWIFWVNIPIGLIALVLACILLQDAKRLAPLDFDFRGYSIVSAGLTLIVAGCSLIMHGTLSPAVGLLSCAGGLLLLLGIYPRYCRHRNNNLLDVALLNLPTFRSSLMGGIPFRVANGSVPFLLPIFFQTSLGFTSFQSGVLVFASGTAAMLMNSRIAGLLQVFGFRQLLAINGMICALFLAVLTVAIQSLSFFWMIAVLFIFGLFRSIQYSCITALAYADVSQKQLSSATSVVSISHPLSNAVGVSLGAMFLELSMLTRSNSHTPVAIDFTYAFLMIGLIGFLSALAFFKLSRDAGREMTGRI